MKQKLLVRFFLLAALFPIALHAADLQAVFTTDSDHTIPSLPVTFRVAISNASSYAVAVPRGLAVRVTTPAGDVIWPEIAVTRSVHWAGWPVEYQDLYTLGPGETRIFELPAYQNGFFQDRRLN